MATIYDIAELSKTSAATVSYVLNGRGDEKRISKATQERILNAAERLNYRPNITARQLKSTGKPIIRLAILWPEFYFEQPLVSAMRAIRDVIRPSADSIELSFHFFTLNNLQERWEKFSPLNYNGIILAGAALDDLEYISQIQKTVPIVLVNRTHRSFPSVSIDHTVAGQMAADMAFERGKDSVCAIWDNHLHVATNLRRTAFVQRAAELHMNLQDSQYICEGASDAGYELGLKLIQRGLLKKVVYCNNEGIAKGMLTALNESGIAVGQEVLLFTANNGPDSFCRFSSPSISSIDLRMQEVFSTALQLCLSIIGRSKDENSVVTIQPKCVFRASMPK